jgi:hypothetical protein
MSRLPLDLSAVFFVRARRSLSVSPSERSFWNQRLDREKWPGSLRRVLNMRFLAPCGHYRHVIFDWSLGMTIRLEGQTRGGNLRFLNLSQISRSQDTRLAFFFRNCFHDPGRHLSGFLMAIVRVKVGTHSQQDLLHLFSGLGFRDEQPATGATCALDRFPLLQRFKKLKGSVLAHALVSHTKDQGECS